MEVILKLFAERGIVGQCSCKGAVDVIGSTNNDPLNKINTFACSCISCGKTWKVANSIKEAIDNFGNDVIMVL